MNPEELDLEALDDPTLSLRELRRATRAKDPQVRRKAQAVLQARRKAREQARPLYRARHSQDPGELLRLAGHPSRKVRSAALANPAFPESLREACQRLLDGKTLDEESQLVLAPAGPYLQRRLLDQAASTRVFWKIATHEGMHLVVEHPRTPAKVLRRIAEGVADPDILRRIAAHPNTPIEVLEALYTEPELRPYLASNPSLNLKLIRKLAKDPDWEVRETLAGNPVLPAAVIRYLVRFAWNEEVGLRLAGQRRTSADVLRRLMAHQSLDVRKQVARHPNADPDTLRRLAGDVHAGVRLEVAAHPFAPADVLELLAEDSHPLVCLAARGGSLSHKNPSVRRAALRNLDLYPEQVADAARDPDPLVRLAAAIHPACPNQERMQVIRELPCLPTDLERLRASTKVRIFQNAGLIELRILSLLPGNPPAVFDCLYATHNPRAWDSLAYSPQTPLSVLERLARHWEYRLKLERRALQDEAVRGVILSLDRKEALQPLDEQRLQRFLSSPDEQVRVNLALNPTLPRGAMEQLARDPADAVRAALAGREDLPEELEEVLAYDPSPRVLEALIKRAFLSPKGLLALAHTNHPPAWERVLADAHTPEQALWVLLPHKGLWKQLIQHPSVSPRFLEAFYQRAGVRWAKAIVGHPQASPDLLRQMAMDYRRHGGSFWQRLLRWLGWGGGYQQRQQAEFFRQVASHPNCPEDLRLQIDLWIAQL